jgi:hypothetical protein
MRAVGACFDVLSVIVVVFQSTFYPEMHQNDIFFIF